MVSLRTLSPKTLSTDPCFYVHILDFNQRVIARGENVYNPDSSTALHASLPITYLDPSFRIVLTLRPSVVLNFRLTSLSGYSWKSIDLL